MAVPTYQTDGHGHRVDINPNGELQVIEGDYDLTSFASMSAAATAYNFYLPRIGEQFVITGVLAFANKDISDASSTVIEIYEATTATETTVTRTLLQFGMGRLTPLPFPDVLLLVNEGVYINAKTDDVIIFMNIIGHFIPTIQKPVGS